jgi:hypothetical protein
VAFKKTGGTIHGSNAGSPYANAAAGNSNGHAVYWMQGTAQRLQNSTAGENVNLDSSNNTNWNVHP